MKNYYEILDIEYHADIYLIKKAFRKKAIKYHPDKHFGDKFFSDRFLEIKEAYDTLSDSTKKSDYDNELKKRSQSSESFEKNIKIKNDEDKINEEFRYDPYKSFYSIYDRDQQKTQEIKPIIDFFGNNIPNEMEFFCYPQNIGKIICGFSSLKISDNPRTGFLSGITNLSFVHQCSFIGINGFSESVMMVRRENKKVGYEMNFNNLKGVLVLKTENYRNFIYINTSYAFLWFDNNNNLLRQVESTYKNKNGEPPINCFDYWTNSLAERYMTIYLLDNMENELNQKGYIDFYLVLPDDEKKLQPAEYIKLGVGFINFYLNSKKYEYKFNDIKRIYIEKNILYIEHKNYEKGFFSSKGDVNEILLIALLNKNYFFKALELLIGYKVYN